VPEQHGVGSGQDRHPEHDRYRRHRQSRERPGEPPADGAEARRLTTLAWGRAGIGARPRRAMRSLAPLLWIGPAIALIAVVVLWPVAVLVHASFQNIASDGFVVGGAGFTNYNELWHEPALKGVVIRTVIWVVAVVGVTLLLSLALAHLFNHRLPLRRAARTALIAPWAASVMMTALILRWALDPYSGAVNIILHALGLVKMGSNTADWLGRPTWALIWMDIVAIFVSLPFTTYALLSGLQTIPDEGYEA